MSTAIAVSASVCLYALLSLSLCIFVSYETMCGCETCPPCIGRESFLSGNVCCTLLVHCALTVCPAAAGVLANHRRICENHYYHMHIIFKRAVKIESVFNMCVTIMPFLCLLESFTFTVFHSLNRSGIYSSKVLPSYIQLQLQLQLHWLYSTMTSFRKW